MVQVAKYRYIDTTYNLLNYAIDSIVESNKEKRHDAYYVNIFKYGILNNIFAYTIPLPKIIPKPPPKMDLLPQCW